MRFIGNKQNLLEQIYLELSKKQITGESFFDFFSGTSSVAKFFKKKNFKIFSSDLLYFSYCLQEAYVENNNVPKFTKLLNKITTKNKSLFDSELNKVLDYLNDTKTIEGFIYKNYSVGGTQSLSKPRMYLSDNNAKKIDAIRQKIEQWNTEKLLTKNEYFILITCLIESVSFYTNVAGVYAAFQKKWDPRALKDFIIKPIELIYNEKENHCYFGNSMNLIKDIDVDILYLDPPYNERQYAPNYHLLETIAKYDDPEIHGITGIRSYDNQKSTFCNKITALEDLEKIVKNAKYKYLLLSYNTEGIMPEQDIKNILKKYGKLDLIEFKYLRFKSNNNGESKTKKHINEQLYILKSF